MNEYAVEFDQLLHNYEYDNQQYIKSIEKENQLITDLSRDIEMTRLSITKLQASVSEMDESTKRVHKQYTMNRDNCVSLKKTSALLTQHSTALISKLDIFSCKYKKEQAENQKMMDYYWSIWKDYDVKYQSLSFVQILENKMKEMSITETQLNDKKEEKQKLITNLNDLQGSIPLNSQELKKFLVDLSQLKLNSNKKQENISLLGTKIKQKRIEKEKAEMTLKVNSMPEEPESNKENIQPDVSLAPEEPRLPERMEDQLLDNRNKDFGSSMKSQSSEPKMNVSLQLGNPSLNYGRTNLLILKSCEKTTPSFHHGSLFKQPDVNYAKNQRNNALNTKVSQPPVSTSSIFAPEDIMMSPKTSISEISDNTFHNVTARPTERTNIAMSSLQTPLIQKFTLNQASPGNFNQLSKVPTTPSTPVRNSDANVPVVSPVSQTPNQMQGGFTPALFPSPSPQISIPVPKLPSDSPSSSQQSISFTPPQGTSIPKENNEGTFDFGEHQNFLKKFQASPGAPILKQRPMFDLTDQKANDEDDDEKKRAENPFFLQSFFNDQDETSKDNSVTVKSSETSFMSIYTDPFSGFGQNNGNERTASPMDLGFSNSIGDTSSDTNFFSSFDCNSQAEESTTGFSFNFNSTSNSDTSANATFSLF